MNKLYPIILLLFLSSCVTSNQVGLYNYKPVSENRVFHEGYSFNENGNIIIKRDSGFFGSALDAEIAINNNRFFEIFPGEYFRFNLEPGTYFFTVISGKEGSFGPPYVRSLKIETTRDRNVIIRVFPMPMQGMVIEEILE